MGEPMLERKYPGLLGKRFGRLVIINGEGRTAAGLPAWMCQCDCGNVTVVSNGNLSSTKSCGCWRRDDIGNRRRVHGGYKTREFKVWFGMIARCHNPNNQDYYLYGERGIRVCDEWQKSFAAFIAHMGPRPFPKAQIDRIDNNGNYEPGNCHWTTGSQNARNTRRNHLMTHAGITCTMAEWEERTGISQNVLYNRAARGWTDERALTTPNKGYGSNGSTYKCR